MVVFGQLVLGPSGSGKSSYCKQFKQSITNRHVLIVNLDPANASNECDIDIHELISLEDCMLQLKLGPNGGLLYCMEYLLKHVDDWLLPRIAEESKSQTPYLMFDLPGQLELFTHHTALKDLISILSQRCNYRLCSVHLVDAHHCTDAGKYLSVLMLALCSMIHLELPHVNVLSKIDLMEAYGKLAFKLDFYTQVQDLEYLLPHLPGANDQGKPNKFAALNEAIVSLIQDFNLVSFHPLCIDNPKLLANLVAAIDRANGYAFGAGDEGLFTVAAGDAMQDEAQDWILREVEEQYLAEYLEIE